MAKKNIKEEIIQTARRLFNQNSYNGVSMRDIADALGISVGNLTYHYPRKEELMEAVVLDMHQYYQPLPTPRTLQELNAIFSRMQNKIQQNAFYFWHYTQLSEISPAVKEIQTQMVRHQYNLLQEAFANFNAAGLFAPPVYEQQYSQLAHSVQMLCIYWVPQSKLEEDLDTPKDFLNCVWSILFPFLTQEGRSIYREKILNVRVQFDAQGLPTP